MLGLQRKEQHKLCFDMTRYLLLTSVFSPVDNTFLENKYLFA